MNNMRKLGIDYGDSRIGIAISDELGITAQGLETIHHNGNDKKLLARLDEIIKEFPVDTIVVGMPLLLNGDKSARAEITEKFIHKLKNGINEYKDVLYSNLEEKQVLDEKKYQAIGKI